uniref:SUEL-type lectin domain-containing protein n=1 Tax=Dicentrarchus labrax TaxID=13489 RepID=A0A8C4IJB5_DICLA
YHLISLCSSSVLWAVCYTYIFLPHQYVLLFLSDEGQVIFVYGADYGRRDSTTCSYGRHVYQVTNVHCRGPSKILHLLCIHSCNGKNSCLVSASNSVFGDPCYGTYKYLEVTYRCQFHTVACEGSVARLKCGEGQVISVYSAIYGRSDRTTCASERPQSQIHNASCSSSSDNVARSCNGKSSCSVSASNSVFGDPCFGTYKYLEVAYACHGE